MIELTLPWAVSGQPEDLWLPPAMKFGAQHGFTKNMGPGGYLMTVQPWLLTLGGLGTVQHGPVTIVYATIDGRIHSIREIRVEGRGQPDYDGISQAFLELLQLGQEMPPNITRFLKTVTRSYVKSLDHPAGILVSSLCEPEVLVDYYSNQLLFVKAACRLEEQEFAELDVLRHWLLGFEAWEGPLKQLAEANAAVLRTLIEVAELDS